MKATGTNLGEVSDLVHTELAKYPGEAFVTAGVTSELLPGPDGEDYMRTLVSLEDGHPKLDPRVINRFPMQIDPLCEERGFETPTISYTIRSEISP